MPTKSGKNKFECFICKKKFKNETSLNYHEMFHTEEERKAAEGIKVAPANIITGKVNYKDFDSEEDFVSTKKKVRNKKVVKKRNSNIGNKKESLKAATKRQIKSDAIHTDDDSEFETSVTKSSKNKSLNTPTITSCVNSNNVEKTKTFSEISGDSDSESASCDSKYLSLKHISRSMKKTSKPIHITKHYSSSSDNDRLSSKFIQKEIDQTESASDLKKGVMPKKDMIDLKSVTDDMKYNSKSQGNKEMSEENDCAPMLAISETESEDEVASKDKNKEPELTPDPNIQVNSPGVNSLSESPKTLRRIKFGCEKCRKKFNDPMALEYHKITFHVEEDTASPASSIDRENQSRKLLKETNLAKKQESCEKTKQRSSSSKKKKELTDSDTGSLKSISNKRKGPDKKIIPPKKQKVIESDKAKSKCLTGIFRKRKPSESSDDESQIKRFVNYNKSNILPSKSIQRKQKTEEPSSDSDDALPQDKSRGLVKNKKTVGNRAKNSNNKPKSKLNVKERKHTYKHETSDEDSSPFRQKINPKILLPEANAVQYTSDSEESSVNLHPKNKNMQKISDGKKEKSVESDSDKYVSDISEPERSTPKSVLSLKTKKICTGCGRAMANESVLAYHMIRCSGGFEKYKLDYSKKTSNKVLDIDKLGDKKIKKPEVKKGGDLKDIYAARSRKKIDYLEVSDFEESDENANEHGIFDGTELKQATKVDVSSDESDFEVNKIVKKKVLKKKVSKKKSDSSGEEPDRIPAATLKSQNKKKKEQKTRDSLEERLPADNSISKPSPMILFKNKDRTDKNITVDVKEKIESRKKQQQIVSESDKSSLDGILLSTDEDKNVKEFYKSEDSKSEGSQYPFKNKKVQDIISNVKKSNEKMVTSDSEPEIVKKETTKNEIVEIKDNDNYENESLSNKIREKLLATKSEKVKCENCNKTFKNSVILQYHQLHCIMPKKSLSSSPNHLVEKKIIISKKSSISESPVDMILKKLSEKVHNSATNSPNSSPNSVSSYKFFKTKNDEVKSPPHVTELLKSGDVENQLDVECKICGMFNDSKTILEHIREYHDEKISVAVKKISKFDLNRYKEGAPNDQGSKEKMKSFNFGKEDQTDLKSEGEIFLQEQRLMKALTKEQKEGNGIRTSNSNSLNKYKETSRKRQITSSEDSEPDQIESTEGKIHARSNIECLQKGALVSDDSSSESVPQTENISSISKNNTSNHNRKLPTDNSTKFTKVNAPKKGSKQIKTKKTEKTKKTNVERDSSFTEEEDKKIKGNRKFELSDTSEDEWLDQAKIKDPKKSIDIPNKNSSKVFTDSDSDKITNDEGRASTIPDEPVKKKKKSKKEKKKKSKKKSKKSKHKRHNSSSSDSEEEEKKKKRKKKHKKHHGGSDVSESPAPDVTKKCVEDEKDEEDVQDADPKEEEISYCFCEKPETEDMIG